MPLTIDLTVIIKLSPPRTASSFPQYRAEYHLNVLDERIMPIVIAVNPHFVRVNHCVIVLNGNVLCIACIAFFLFLCYIFRNHLILQAVLQCGGASICYSKFGEGYNFGEYYKSILFVFLRHQNQK